MIGRMSITLAIETSQRLGSVALCDHTGAVHVEPLSPVKRHDDDLLAAIDRIFARARLSPTDMPGGTSETANGGIVAVSIGPGGFTGLRIAVSTAKMFAEAAGTKIVAVPSALVATESSACWGHDASFAAHVLRNATQTTAPTAILVALACKGDSCWLTRVVHDGESWAIAGEPGLKHADTLDVQGIAAVLADAYFPEPMRQRCEQSGVSVIEPVFDARACLSIARTYAHRQQFVDPLVLTPLYPREPEAVTLWNQREATARSHRATVQ